MIAGVCKYCGCSMQRACPGMCCWINEEQTICSACVPKMTIEDLLPAVNLDHAALAGTGFPLMFGSPELVALLGVIQVGLCAISEAGLPSQSESAKFVSGFVQQMLEALENQGGYAAAEFIRRASPAQGAALDPPPPKPESKIIIP